LIETMPNQTARKTFKLIGGIIAAVLITVPGPYALSYLQLIPQLNDHAWQVLAVAAISLVLKVLVGDVASGEFLWYKFGYDNCILTFGAVLTALALQLATTKDLFPGLDAIVGIKIFTSRRMQPQIGQLSSLRCFWVRWFAHSSPPE
jgi:hypothetical protein